MDVKHPLSLSERGIWGDHLKRIRAMDLQVDPEAIRRMEEVDRGITWLQEYCDEVMEKKAEMAQAALQDNAEISRDHPDSRLPHFCTCKEEHLKEDISKMESFVASVRRLRTPDPGAHS